MKRENAECLYRHLPNMTRINKTQYMYWPEWPGGQDTEKLQLPTDLIFAHY